MAKSRSRISDSCGNFTGDALAAKSSRAAAQTRLHVSSSRKDSFEDALTGESSHAAGQSCVRLIYVKPQDKNAKLKCGSNKLVPTVSPKSEWFRAPSLKGDCFWDQRLLLSLGRPQKGPILLMEPEPESEDHIPPASIPWLNLERGNYPYSFCHFLNYTAPVKGMDP